MPEAKPNADLVKMLKKAVAMAEAGQIADGVIVAIGPELYHRDFAVVHGHGMPTIIGELGMFKTEMEVIVMQQRTEQAQKRAAGFVGRPHFQA